MHCNLKKVLTAVAEQGAKTLADIKHLVPDVRKPQVKVTELVKSGHLAVTETGEFEPTEKGASALR